MKIEPHIRIEGTEHWAALMLFVCLLLLVWVKTEYPRKIPVLFREVFTGELAIKEKGITLPSILLFFIYLTCLSLLIMRIAPYFIKFNLSGWWNEFLLFFAILLVYYLGETLLLLITGFIFEVQSAVWDYISEIYIFTHFSGIILLPLAAIVLFTYGINLKLTGEILLTLTGLLVLYRTARMFILMIAKGLRPFYLILYICCLEIVPLALFIKYGLIIHLQ